MYMNEKDQPQAMDDSWLILVVCIPFYQERLIFCMVPLEHADAEQLADVLAPFLSSQGKIKAYSPTNTLIIEDQPEVVKMLIKVIKGKADLSECQNFQNGPESKHQIPSD